MATLVIANGHRLADDLIPEFARVVLEAKPAWFVMENVPGAPLPDVGRLFIMQERMVNNRDTGGEQNRIRRITFGCNKFGPPAPQFDVDFQPQPMAWAPAVLARSGGRAQPVAYGGSGKPKRRNTLTSRRSAGGFREACRLQGLPDDFDLPPFTSEEKMRAIGNGVPLPMGRAVARAVAKAIGFTPVERAA